MRFAPLIILSFLIITFLTCTFLLGNTFWGDPNIYLIYARNIAVGHPFSYNPGEFSSGSTSPIWPFVLSIGYLWTDPVPVIKGIAFVSTLVSLVTCFIVFRTITGSEIGSALGVSILARFLVMPGLLLYETSVAVTAVSLMVLFTWHILKQRKNEYKYLAVVWGIASLLRPELILLVAFDALLILMMTRRVPWLLIPALLPISLYWGYSYFQTGMISVSAACRAYALKEMRFDPTEYTRYMITLFPVIFIPLVLTIKWMERLSRAVVAIFAVVISMSCFWALFTQSAYQAGRGLTFDVIMERTTMKQVNTIAKPGDTVLMYEIQGRYFLDPRLSALSLDGITDGKIGPYFDDVSSFLKRYRPSLWAADEAVTYRPYLSRSILAKAVENAPFPGNSWESDGIRFINVWANPAYIHDPGFNNVKAIYQIEYP